MAIQKGTLTARREHVKQDGTKTYILTLDGKEIRTSKNTHAVAPSLEIGKVMEFDTFLSTDGSAAFVSFIKPYDPNAPATEKKAWGGKAGGGWKKEEDPNKHIDFYVSYAKDAVLGGYAKAPTPSAAGFVDGVTAIADGLLKMRRDLITKYGGASKTTTATAVAKEPEEPSDPTPGA